MMPTTEQLSKEVTMKTSRSGGKGGQHVNKVSSKVELIFNIQHTSLFSEEERSLLLEKLEKKLDSEGNIHIIAQKDRSQLANKALAFEKLINVLTKSLQVHKKRKPTKIPKAIIEKRLNDKLAKANKKENRRKPIL